MTLDTLAIYNGNLCLKTVDTANESPQFIIRYYTMFPCTKAAAEYNGFPLGARMVRTGEGVYTPHDGDDRRHYALSDYGRTMSSKPEFKDIPKPKTGGKPLRWHYGQWQKLLRTGWVNLGVDLKVA